MKGRTGGWMRLGGSVASLTAALIAGPVAAQDQAGVEDIVVTAQKREESLQDVPIAVSAFTASALEARGATALTSLLQTPPRGVVMQPFAGSQTLLIVDMRGVTNGDPGQGTTELGTAVYIDDVYMGRAQGMGAELADPERIEVLRGPQGQLFGRNAEGGAIRIVTKKPTGELGGNAKVTYGNFDQQRYEAHINLPSIAGFAVKLDYINASHDGWTANGPRVARIVQQDSFGALDAEGYRAAARWKPTDGITVDYAYDDSVTRDTRDYNVLVQPPFGFAPAGPLTPLTTFQGARAPDPSIHQRVDTAWTSLYNAPYRTKAFGHTLQASWDMTDHLTLRSITALRKTREVGANQLGGAFSLSRLGPTGQPIQALVPGLGTTSLGLDPATRAYAISGVVSYNDVDQKQESQELQLIGTFPGIEFVAGAYYFHERVKDTRQSFLSIVYTDAALTQAVGTNPFTVGSAGAGLTSQTAVSTSYAGFGQATWTPGFSDDRLHITAGIRYTDDKKTFVRTINNGLPVNVVGAPFGERRWDPAFTVAYDFSDTIHAYAKYSQAYRAGGVSVRSPNFRPFGSEVNKAFEIGVKSDLLDRKLRLNTAIFENRVSNRQITAQLDPTGNPAVTDTLNAPGVTRIRGAELEVIAVPVRGLQVAVNYAYLEGKRPPSYLVIDPNAELRIQSLPRHAVSATVDYTVPVGTIGDLAFHLDHSLASKTPGTGRVAYGAFAYDIDRYVTNARIALQDIPVGPSKWRVAAFAKNIFDTAYPVFTAPGANAILSAPRTYGLEVGTSF